MTQETTVLSATDSVVVEQVNLIPGDDGTHLVVDNGTGHLVEMSGTHPVQQVYLPCVPHVVPQQDDWKRRPQVRTNFVKFRFGSNCDSN